MKLMRDKLTLTLWIAMGALLAYVSMQAAFAYHGYNRASERLTLTELAQ